jgi:hypothetical protein
MRKKGGKQESYKTKEEEFRREEMEPIIQYPYGKVLIFSYVLIPVYKA